ncbi:hypothetical protein CYMTET_51414 [Cymbomonas tetramitiformis]|uniref:Reverse transcriptase domain-containing protein n=1 Tax=Cymbomonas tetramitiformis TaxID=36881 RepID=A0AAE0BL43_9CHLO|nr:hypothetical protein CYMTET_51414 [Cymbomonas tetramitiformis]
MLEFALSGGEFEPADFGEDEDDGMVTLAKLVPPGRGGPAFCEAIMEAADQCVEVLVGELGFKVHEVPQASLSQGARGAGKDRRDAESEGERDEEEQVEEDLFGEDEEDAEKSRKLKQMKCSDGEPSPEDLAADEALKWRVDAWLGARRTKLRKKVADPVTGEMKSVAVPRLSKDQFLEQNFEMVEKIPDVKERALFRRYISWILTLTEKYSWADVYDFDAQVRDDFAQGRVTTWDPVPLASRFQYSFAESLGEVQKRLTDDRGGKKSHTRDSKARDKKRDGLCDFFQSARGCKKGKDCGFVSEAAPLYPVMAAGKARDEMKAKKVGKWSAKFLAMFTVVGVSLASYGVPEADWLRYQHDVVAVGARVSPLTERADRWAQAAWGLPVAEEVVRGVASGFRWQQERLVEFFEVENYVPPEHQEKVQRKLQEEEDAGRMSRGFPGVVVYLDDFLLVADSEEVCQQGFDLLLELVEYLGFDVAPEKVESSRQDIVFLGGRLRSNQSGLGVVAMSIEESRVQRVAAECRHVAGLKKVRVKEVGRLVGQQMFCARVVYGAKMFLRSGYDFLGKARRMRRVFDSVPEGLNKDLRWLAEMLDTNNGQAVVFVIFWALKLWGHLLRGCKIVLWSNNESARLMTENLWGKPLPFLY